VLKKFGMVSVGVTAGLLAIAPMASASEGHHHGGGDQHGTGNIQCGAEGGDLSNDTTGTGAIALGQAAGPVASGNAGQLLSCNSFLNDNLNDASVNVLSHQVL
jgi:hypothetical protein